MPRPEHMNSLLGIEGASNRNPKILDRQTAVTPEGPGKVKIGYNN
jgi:hypothetical protein